MIAAGNLAEAVIAAGSAPTLVLAILVRWLRPGFVAALTAREPPVPLPVPAGAAATCGPAC